MKLSGVLLDGAGGRRRVAAVTAAAAASLTLGLAGCSTQSPAVIATPYQAADGTSAVIPGVGVKLRNFVVVSAAKGEPGQVVGAVVNSGATAVTVTMQTDLGATGQPVQTAITVPPHGITEIGPKGTVVSVSDTPVAPGALMGISADSASSGGITITVPVVPPTGYYSSYTAAATPPAASPSASGTAGPSASASSSAAPKATPEPTSST